MSDWFMDRLGESSTWSGIIVGASTLLGAFVPEATTVATALLGVVGAFEVCRKER